MDQSVFDFDSYRSYLATWIKTQPHRGHGAKATLARAANCQTAYISQVMREKAHLSLEQGERIAQFLKLSLDETEYFLVVLQKERAGTESLRRIFTNQMKRMNEHCNQLKNRVQASTEISLEAQATYFSSWIYTAIHILVTIPGFQKTEPIAMRLGLPANIVLEVLEFLHHHGLIAKNGDVHTALNSRIHLPHDSPLISKHHMNWRIRTLRNLETRNDESLHYSSVVSISEKEAKIIRAKLLKSIEDNKKTIKNSPEEKLYSYCLDFFEL